MTIINGTTTTTMNLSAATSISSLMMNVVLCWWVGIQLTIFFKKSFSFKNHISIGWDVIPSVFILFYYKSNNILSSLSYYHGQDGEEEDTTTAMFLFEENWLDFIIVNIFKIGRLVGLNISRIFLIPQHEQHLILGFVYLFVLIIRDITTRRLNSHVEIVKSIILGCSIYLASEASPQVLQWLSISVLATTQLLRWPNHLKMKLRTIRTIFGPCYTICITGAYWRKQHQDSFLFYAALSSCLASFMFRPDNNEQLCIWLFATPLIKIMTMMTKKNGNRQQEVDDSYGGSVVVVKKYIHAVLMISSLCFVSYSFLILTEEEEDFPTIVFFKSTVIMTLFIDMICTILGTDTFQKLVINPIKRRTKNRYLLLSVLN